MVPAVAKVQTSGKFYLDYALTAALSFSTVETLGFMYVASETLHESWPKLLLTLAERMVGTLGHSTCAALTAMRATRRDCYGEQISWFGVIAPAVFFHGLFDFVAFSASALGGNVGWIHPTGVRDTSALLGACVSVVGAAVWIARREWSNLEERERRRG